MRFKISQPLAIQQLGSRSNQEDSIFPLLNEATINDRLFILCDGMGGHESGEVASSTVCKTISKYILSRHEKDNPLCDGLINEAITAAYSAVDEQDPTGEKKMGTTLTFLCFHKEGCTVAHIGDSRIYHFRPSTNEILYRSRDHSLVYDLFEVGELSQEELKTARNKNVITRVIMAHQERPSKADIVHITNIEPGDYFYLCSDGMLEQMEDQALLDIFRSDNSDEQKRNILIGETVDNSDNHSAYILRIESVEREEGDNNYLDNEAAARAANKVLMAELNPTSVTAPPPPPLPETEADSDDDVQVVMAEPVPPQPTPTPQHQTPTPQPPTSSPQPSTSKKGKVTFFLVAAVFFFFVVAAIVIVFFFMNNKPKNEPVIINDTPTETTISREDIDDDDDDDGRSSAYPQRQAQPQRQGQPQRQATPITPSRRPNGNVGNGGGTPERTHPGSDPSKTNSNAAPAKPTPQQGTHDGGTSSEDGGRRQEIIIPNI